MESMVVVVALIPVPLKIDATISSNKKILYRTYKTFILQEVIAGPVHYISVEDNLLFVIVCSNGLVQICNPKVTAWITNHLEHIKI
jgi:hypothetical protein